MEQSVLKTNLTKAPKRKKINMTLLFVTIFLIIYVFIIYVPFYWAFLTAFKDRNQLRENILFKFPTKWRWDNLTTVLYNFEVTYNDGVRKLTFNYLNMMWNSFSYTFVSVTVQTTCLYLTAYACAMFRYKWSGFMEAFNLFVMSTPIFGSLPSSIKVFSFLGLYENFWGIAVVTKFTWTGMYFFVVEAAVRSVPKAYVEAAQIDGAGNLSILFRVMLPLTINMYFILYLLNFIASWNSYGDVYVYLKSYPTAAYGLWVFDNDYSGDVSGVQFKLAGGLLVVMPVLVLFIFFNKQLMNGLSMAEGVKE